MATNQLKEEIVLNSSQFDRNINNVIKKVEELKNKGSKVGGGFNSSMGKMIEQATGFNGSMKSLIGTATKLGGALGLLGTSLQLTEWFKNAIAEGSKLAQEGEGIRIAFERLNQGDLLENLRRETHNTVTDIELMKQAVKFNDFKLNINELGTLLAFAQQKAKDTGQSIDYMVDSIVTGLGRKSLPILDNLGLSAAEIKEKMKESGDMTKAVAEIIKDKMNQAGGYVETAADRAKQKEVELQNELEELGRTFQPLQETSSNFWHSIELGAIRAINNLRPLINEFTELGRILNSYNMLGGDKKLNRMLGTLTDDNGKLKKNAKSIYDQQLRYFDDYINKIKFKIAAFGNDKSSIAQSAVARLNEQLAAANRMKSEYQKQAKDLYNKSTAPAPNTANTTTSSSTKVGKDSTVNYAIGSVGYLEQKINDLQKKIKLQVDASEIKKLQDEIKATKEELDYLLNGSEAIEIKPINIDGALNIINENYLKDKLKDFKPIVKTLEDQIKESQDRINSIIDAYDIGLIGSKKAKELIDSVNNQLKSLGLKPIKIHLETDLQRGFNNVEDGANAIYNSFQGIDDIVYNITSLTEALHEGANGWEIFMNVLQSGVGIIQTVSTVLESLNTLQELLGTTSVLTAEQTAAAGATEVATAASVTAAKSGEAVASATAEGAKLPFPFNIAAIAAGIAAVLSSLALIGTFANGGIVGGNSFAGDSLIARVNSGEMILNGSQQKHLFDMIDKGTTTNSLSDVRFVIKGKDLVGVARNYEDKISKVR